MSAAARGHVLNLARLGLAVAVRARRTGAARGNPWLGAAVVPWVALIRHRSPASGPSGPAGRPGGGRRWKEPRR